jgi:hypothetical protein
MCDFLECLHKFSSWAVDDFCNANNNEHRHPIYFPETNEKEGFVKAPNIDEEQLKFAEAWQFEVAPKSNGRAHGFLIGDTFYLVWLDPCHRLFPLKASNGRD